MKWLTHCNPVNLRVVGLVVITVEGFLSKGEGSTDGLRVLDVLRRCCQVLVNVVHGRNYGDKGCFGSYMKPYNLILLSMILQLE